MVFFFFFNCTDGCTHMCKTVSLLLGLTSLETENKIPWLRPLNWAMAAADKGEAGGCSPPRRLSEPAPYFWLFFLWTCCAILITEWISKRCSHGTHWHGLEFHQGPRWERVPCIRGAGMPAAAGDCRITLCPSFTYLLKKLICSKII